MIQITPHMRILVAVKPIDFRAGIDALAAACRQRLECDPLSGAVFVFCNRARTGIKVLIYDLCGEFSNVELLSVKLARSSL